MSISGVVQAVSEKLEANSKFGPAYRIGVNVEGTWSNLAFSKKTAAELGLVKGATVSFQYKTTSDPKYKDIDVKTLSVVAPTEAATQAAAPASTQDPSPGQHGDPIQKRIQDGMYLNCATALAAAEGKAPTVDRIVALAKTVKDAHERIVAGSWGNAPVAAPPTTQEKPAASKKTAPVVPEDFQDDDFDEVRF